MKKIRRGSLLSLKKSPFLSFIQNSSFVPTISHHGPFISNNPYHPIWYSCVTSPPHLFRLLKLFPKLCRKLAHLCKTLHMVQQGLPTVHIRGLGYSNSFTLYRGSTLFPYPSGNSSCLPRPAIQGVCEVEPPTIAFPLLMLVQDPSATNTIPSTPSTGSPVEEPRCEDSQFSPATQPRQIKLIQHRSSLLNARQPSHQSHRLHECMFCTSVTDAENLSIYATGTMPRWMIRTNHKRASPLHTRTHARTTDLCCMPEIGRAHV